MTCKGIIQSYLANLTQLNNKVVLPSHVFEVEIVNYGKSHFQKLYTPGTYSREFRRIREKGLFDNLFKITEETEKSHYKYFIIERK